MQDFDEPAYDPRTALIEHLRAFGGGNARVEDWTVPNAWAPQGFSIVTMEPSQQYPWWNFATVGCWQVEKGRHHRSEFILCANDGGSEHIELLKMAAFLHLNPRHDIALAEVLDIGRAWVDGSACTHLLASPPYPFGSYFEYPDVKPCTRFIWLLPITAAEAALVEREDVERLERLLDEHGVDFVDPFRASVAV